MVRRTLTDEDLVALLDQMAALVANLKDIVEATQCRSAECLTPAQMAKQLAATKPKRRQPAAVQEINPERMTTTEAAKYLGLKKKVLENWRSDQVENQPDYLKLGAAVRYRQSDLDRWIEQNSVTH